MQKALLFSSFCDTIEERSFLEVNCMILYEYETECLSVNHILNRNPKSTTQKIHMHNNYELYCFVGGDVRYLIEGREISLDYGTVLLMCPGELHTAIMDSEKPYERYVLNFTSAALPEELRDSLLRPFRSRPLGEMNVYRASNFSGVTPRDLLSVMCTSGGNEDLRIRTMLPTILMLLQSATPKESRQKDPRSLGIQMVDFVNAHLCDPVTVSMVAEEFYMSVSQVSRIFKGVTGTTIGQYSLTKRLLKARRRISGGASAQQAALDCGFGCYSSFFRLYKKKFGVAPSERSNFTVEGKEIVYD